MDLCIKLKDKIIIIEWLLSVLILLKLLLHLILANIQQGTPKILVLN